jgi:hypothetical protein
MATGSCPLNVVKSVTLFRLEAFAFLSLPTLLIMHQDDPLLPGRQDTREGK